MALEPLIGKHHPLALKVRDIVDPLVRRRGLFLVDIQYTEGGGAPHLRVFADAPGGISLTQLQDLSETVGDILDAEDPLPSRYTLEVSSPGVDRPMTQLAHFEAAKGTEVLVVTTTKIDGSRKHRGMLTSVGAQDVVVLVDGSARTLPLHAVDHAHTIYKFQAADKPGKKPKAPSKQPAQKPSTIGRSGGHSE